MQKNYSSIKCINSNSVNLKILFTNLFLFIAMQEINFYLKNAPTHFHRLVAFFHFLVVTYSSDQSPVQSARVFFDILWKF